ncbi:NIPSNAP family protein [Catellatospora bangladeshensis]|uniref:NIPSNAP family containing protein n=1 Tax=Catellatospora bangladeshensis TaxID=310355 RepID=A0A8J3JC53_9ACTN|nr:NIPSNAP family protein [Catellatospora bangladeshensis]GIF81576.1 NIPSNAP family containing protein [Catellatospora bangladeshensis]
MQGSQNSVVELRQYTLHPGRRDVLIDLFDREFVETQEAAGMTVLGQFRDLDDPDRFVWLRGFDGMPRRAQALGRFYGGPVWKAHRDQANATMIDSDDVLLLRPVAAGSGFPAPATPRPPAGRTAAPPSLVLATLYYRDRPFDEAFVDFFDRRVRPVLAETGAAPLACLQTEHADNDFPALPVRTGENVFVWFARFGGPADLDDHQRRLRSSARWQEQVWPALSAMLSGAPQQLRLAPTARSLLR